MPYVSVPRDLSKVKNKIAMGLTARQLIAVGAAVVVCLPLYILLRPLGELALYLAIIPSIPCFMYGFYSVKDGRPIEKVFKNYIEVCFKRPRYRPYRTENIYARLALMAEIQEVIESESEASATGDSNQGTADEQGFED